MSSQQTTAVILMAKHLEAEFVIAEQRRTKRSDQQIIAVIGPVRSYTRLCTRKISCIWLAAGHCRYQRTVVVA